MVTVVILNHRTRQEGQNGPVLLDLQTSFESISLLVQEKFNVDFQDGCHLGFPIQTILASFDLQVTLILPMKF